MQSDTNEWMPGGMYLSKLLQHAVFDLVHDFGNAIYVIVEAEPGRALQHISHQVGRAYG